MTVGKIISEPWAIFNDIVPKKDWDKKIKDLLKDEKYLDKILEEGSKKADNLASKKITEMKTLVGF